MIIPYTGKNVDPHYVTCIDIETSPAGEIIGIGMAWEDGGTRNYAAFETCAEWLDTLRHLLVTGGANSRRYHRIFAHNGANFDYLKLYSDLAALGEIDDGQYFTADSTGIGCMFKIRGIKTPIYLMDSYRLMPASLAKLGDTYAIQDTKKEIPFECRNDYAKFKALYPTLFWDYLRADVVGLQQIIHAFWTQIYHRFGNIGQLPMTLPSLAMRIFSKQLNAPIMTPENQRLKDLERRAYKGGLTLCLRTGIFDNVNVYDVNSMYPAAMAENEYPIDYAGYWTGEFEPHSTGLWEATYEQTNTTLPPFLFDSSTGAAYHGTGIFTTSELVYLQRCGGYFTTTQGYVYERTAPLFRDFIAGVYQDRQQATLAGDEATSFTLKILMNSLYGKFAQREEGDTIDWYTYDRLDSLVEAGKKVKIMGDFLVHSEARVVPHVFVGIAAMITANARIDLHRRMSDVIRRGYQVYYCDTDSIHTNGTIIEATGLGGLKLEASGRAAYAGRKLYAFDGGKIKAKGIGRRTVGDSMTFDDIALLAMNKDIQKAFSFEGFPSVKGVLSKKERAAVMRVMTRRIRNTGGLWDQGV